MFSSEATTRGIRVHVQSHYVAERSDPDQNQWFFAYQVRITNDGTETAQLVSRHWIITDGEARVEEIKGEGVVGQQPVLEPGETFEYTSGCPLQTQFGTMHGAYQMVTRSGVRFDARIAPFALGQPNMVN